MAFSAKDTVLLKNNVSMKNLRDFSWSQALSEASSIMPLVMELLECLIPNKKLPVIGNVLATILYSQKPKTFKFIPTVNGVEVFNSGGSVKCLTSLNHAGFSCGVKGARNALDKIKKENVDTLYNWKGAIEVCDIYLFSLCL